MGRKDKINAMTESKFDELKILFIDKTKQILISSIKEKMKTLFVQELAMFKEELNKKINSLPQQVRYCSST